MSWPFGLPVHYRPWLELLILVQLWAAYALLYIISLQLDVILYVVLLLNVSLLLI
jgi:hypothetical protein